MLRILNPRLLKQGDYMWISTFIFQPALLLKALTVTNHVKGGVESFHMYYFKTFYLCRFLDFREFCCTFETADTGLLL